MSNETLSMIVEKISMTSVVFEMCQRERKKKFCMLESEPIIINIFHI